MKETKRPILALALTAIAWLGAQPSVTREIDPAASKVTFSVQHIFVEHVTGVVPILRGNVVLQTSSSIPRSVFAVLDPSKIKTGEDERDGVLQSPDWFDVAQFPTWTFVSTAIVQTSPDAFTMDGLLTIRGVARDERLDVVVSGSAAHPVYRATGEIDRHAFGMATTRLDPVIGNPVEITLDVALQ